MQPTEIKAIVKKYRDRAAGILTVFCLFGILSNYLLNNAMIEKRFELGLPMPDQGAGHILILLLLGLYAVFFICFDAFEDILLKLLDSKKTD